MAKYVVEATIVQEFMVEADKLEDAIERLTKNLLIDYDDGISCVESELCAPVVNIAYKGKVVE